MQVFRRRLGIKNFDSGQQSTLELPRNYALRHLDLLLEATATLAGTPSAGNPLDSCPAGLIQRIEIVRDGSETIKAIDFETLHRLTQRRYRTRPVIDSLPAGYANIADEPVKAHARLNFAMWPGHVRPIDTMLDASRTATLHMIVTWGTAADLMTPDYDGTPTVTAVTLKTSTSEMRAIPPDWTFSDFKEHVLSKTVIAADTEFQFPNLANGNWYRGFTIVAKRNGLPSDLIINEITLKSGSKVFSKLKADQMQMTNRLDTATELPVANDTVNRKYLEGVQTGYYYIDLCPDGRLNEALPSANLSSLELVFDVNNPGANTDKLYVYPEELVLAPIKKVNAA